MYDFVKNVPLFANLPESDLKRLCQMMGSVSLPDGQVLFDEGSPGDRAYIIKEGELEVLKVSGNRNVLLAVRGGGEVIGELALLENKPRMATVRARGEVELLTLSQEQLDHLLGTSPSAAQAMYYTILDRWRSTDSRLRQSEKMAQLGSLTAGVAHELNNPAAAVKRGAEQLETAMNELSHAYVQLSELGLDEGQWKVCDHLSDHAQDQATRPSQMDALLRSDREYELEEWLENQGVEDGWELAPTLVDLDFNNDELDEFAGQFSPGELAILICWMNGIYTVHNLFAELRQGAERISGIVKALKTYSYLDQAPVQAVDIHKGLDDTLLILNHKLRTGISVRRHYAEELPKIQGYGSELNQVWTNIIDNAADALDEASPEHPTITIRTHHEEEKVVVEIEDNGTGIPLEVQAKMFHPFFTTKPPGVGTGLGLDISYNIIKDKHRGQIEVDSHPGSTIFRVILPVDFESCDAAP